MVVFIYFYLYYYSFFHFFNHYNNNYYFFYNVYRTGAASSLFYKEFGNTLCIFAIHNEEVLILGDFNFHLAKSDNTDAQTFLNILRSHGFEMSTNQATHNQGGWLDVIASRKSVNINCIDSGISDHKLLLCSFEMLKPPPIYRQFHVRR